jgi:hypothetical protein
MKKLNSEEIEILVNQTGAKTVSDFTEYKAQQRAMFARSVLNNPLYRQGVVARIMAEGSGDERFVNELLVPEGDQSETTEAQRQQILENSSLALGEAVPVVPKDNDWVHMQTMMPKLQELLMNHQAPPQMLQLGLQHYAAHYSQGVAKKGIPEPEINNQKQFLAQAEKILQGLIQKQQIQQQHQQVLQQKQAAGIPPAPPLPQEGQQAPPGQPGM